MAEGGEVKSFCSQNNSHMPSCAYYAEGGGVGVPMSPLTSLKGSYAAIAHSGASMLFSNPKSPFLSAFGSGSTSSKLAGDDEAANLAQYSSRVKKGSKALENGIGSLFDPSMKHEVEPASEKEVQHIKDYVANGGANQELQDAQSGGMFAEGGQVGKREDPLSTLLPEHNMALNTAKGRVSSYLNSMRPSDIEMKLPFDPRPSRKTANKQYDHVVELAARPMTIIKKIQDGTITPDSLKHFNSMYPELHEEIAKQLHLKIGEAQMEGKKPSYRTRQGMSLFLGTPLDSTFTPASIMAAQATFAQQAAQQQNSAPISKTNKLSKTSEQYQTDSQAADARSKKS